MLAIIKFFCYWSVFFLWVGAFALLVMDNFGAHLRLTDLRPTELQQSDFIRYFMVIFALLWVAYFATNLTAYGRLLRPRKKKNAPATKGAGEKAPAAQNTAPKAEGDKKSPSIEPDPKPETSK